MLSHVLADLRRRARALRFALAGGLLVAVGAVFLTVAVWIALEESAGALFAATVIGAVYLGAGLVFIGLSVASRRPPRPSAPPAGDRPPPARKPLPPLMEAFLFGLSAGMGTERRTERSDRRGRD